MGNTALLVTFRLKNAGKTVIGWVNCNQEVT
ncbi:protein of unknown function [Brevefilum fermentans]|uniref:Uncharacterized protein n=1 Tax=Candidatus Brevifilum fermentans TaxID=1986204 RepID=A0A1Y6K0W7_9CHLR|nr:protein of unknown function [Brevefilum fermentans]